MFKKIILSACVSVTALSVSGCSGYFDHLEQNSTVTEKSSNVASPQEEQAPVVHDSGLAPQDWPALPAREDQTPCPYLDSQWVADVNGQRVLGSGIDTRFETPACVYWSYPEEPQLQVIVRNFNSQQEAIDAVNFFAPVEKTSPARGPVGWEGGRGGWENNSVYAVFKDNRAVIAVSNQGQSVKPQTVVEETIKNLGI